MPITRQTIIHDGPGGPFESVVAFDTASENPRPGVLVIPNILGQKESDNMRAEMLAGLGYVGFAIDLYGQGKRTTRESPNMGVYMAELNNDRMLLQARLLGALAVLQSMPQVDASRTAAIGFCFGGKCALDLARCNADVRGVVSFHGVYDAPPFPNAETITPKVLVCHGWNDPLCPPDVTVALAQELSAGGADWQIHAYGGTGHAFTDEGVNMPERGLAYNPDADRRSWQAMTNFLGEVFS